ncbi:hypothetical protein CEXT_771791 [Caerostris extrusa]|uniref:Uncharacterized protein n=1 Tax=Caerostris extrusa TaxID=172846 RepID=A0AAV4US80_CAEEX|nr:hypothetical protein CEXT_771791 [Caerostris extrusa]
MSKMFRILPQHRDLLLEGPLLPLLENHLIENCTLLPFSFRVCSYYKRDNAACWGGCPRFPKKFPSQQNFYHSRPQKLQKP